MPKSATLTSSRVTEEEVGRLDVAVQHAVLVGVLEAVEGRDRVGAALLAGDGRVALALGQRAAAHPLHDQRADAVAVDVVVDADDVRVVERGQRAGLGLEALPASGSSSRSGERRLIATSRSRRTCRAEYTTAKEPRPRTSPSS